jgi:outer membrane lipase/esterase
MIWHRLASAVIALAICAHLAQARAQSFDNIVVFGDSLSDDGNLFALTGGLFPPSTLEVAPGVFVPGYFNGRFSNGPVWVESLPGYDSDLNFAQGGARTDIFNIVLIPGAIGVEAQIDSFGGAVDGDSLVVLWSGANDLNSGRDPFETAANQIENIQTLIGLGARTILVPNLPDLGATPLVRGTPAAPLATLGTQAFNAALGGGIESVVATADVNIIQMEVFTAFNLVLANPAAFGFVNVTDPCITTPSCVTAPREAQNSFLFWDDIHPTAGGHQLLALYAGLLLSTEAIAPVVSPLAEVGLNSRLDASQAAFNRTLNAVAFPESWRGGLYAEIIGTRLDSDASGPRPGYSYDLHGLRAGAEAKFGNVLIGASLAYLTGDLDQAQLNAEIDTLQADAYGALHVAPFFIGAEAGLSYTEYDNIRRFTGFPTVFASGDTDSLDYSAAISLGAVYDIGGLKLIPAGRLGYVSAGADAFTESAPLLALEFADRDISAGFWSVGLRAAAALGPAGRVTAYAEAGYEDLFAIDADAIGAKLANNTARAVSAASEDPAARGLYFKLGAGGAIAPATHLSIDYGLSLREGEGETHTGKLQLKFLLGAEDHTGASW